VLVPGAEAEVEGVQAGEVGRGKVDMDGAE